MKHQYAIKIYHVEYILKMLLSSSENKFLKDVIIITFNDDLVPLIKCF